MRPYLSSLPKHALARVREPSDRLPGQRKHEDETVSTCNVDEAIDAGHMEPSATVQAELEVKISFCNRAYADRWYNIVRRQNPTYFAILTAIIQEVQLKDGLDISKADFFKRRPEIAREIEKLKFDIVPSGGQMLRRNGNGIRHAKFAPSKSVAVIWEKVGGIVYFTFDDHAPIPYHRAIRHLRDIRLGKRVTTKHPRNTGRFLQNLGRYWKRRYIKEMYGFNPRMRYYE